MNPIPDDRPAQPSDHEMVRCAPVFPLPGVFLFPGQLLPLHVFEPRYRQMIEDSLDGPGRIVIGTVLEKDRGDLEGSPPILPVAGIGEIARHERADDGRFLIWLCGLARVRIDEVESDRLYRKVRYQLLAETPASAGDDADLRPSLTEAVQQHTGSSFESDETVPLGALADLLAQCLTLPETVMVKIHGETEVAERSRKVLAANARFPRRRA